MSSTLDPITRRHVEKAAESLETVRAIRDDVDERVTRLVSELVRS